MPNVACLDMGIGIEVASDSDCLRIDIEAIGVVQVRQVVEEVAHAAAHIQYHFRRGWCQQLDHLPAHFVRRKELADLGLSLRLGIVVVRAVVRLAETMQAAHAGIAVIDIHGRNGAIAAVDGEEDLFVDLRTALRRNMLRDNRVIHVRSVLVVIARQTKLMQA